MNVLFGNFKKYLYGFEWNDCKILTTPPPDKEKELDHYMDEARAVFALSLIVTIFTFILTLAIGFFWPFFMLSLAVIVWAFLRFKLGEEHKRIIERKKYWDQMNKW